MYAKWMPPQHWGKSRFMNVFVVVKWAENILEKEPGLPAAMHQKTIWLLENKEFWSRTLENAFARVQSIGKKTGEYLQVLRSKITDGGTAYLCCSDIIESLFRKFKYARKPRKPTRNYQIGPHHPLFLWKPGCKRSEDGLEMSRPNRSKIAEKGAASLPQQTEN